MVQVNIIGVHFVGFDYLIIASSNVDVLFLTNKKKNGSEYSIKPSMLINISKFQNYPPDSTMTFQKKKKQKGIKFYQKFLKVPRPLSKSNMVVQTIERPDTMTQNINKMKGEKGILTSINFQNSL